MRLLRWLPVTGPVSGARDQLAEALWMRVHDVFASRGYQLPHDDVTHVTNFLAEQALPVVKSLADERAAEALTELADWIDGTEFDREDPALFLHLSDAVRRAASLRAASRGETGR